MRRRRGRRGGIQPWLRGQQLGYTAQHSDGPGGLLYYGARYYDPAAGQFTSADTVLDGLNRYVYVGDNPETATDPSGQSTESSTCVLEPEACAPVTEGDPGPTAPGGPEPEPMPELGPGAELADGGPAGVIALGVLGLVAAGIWLFSGGADRALASPSEYLHVRDTGQMDTLADLRPGGVNPYHTPDYSDTAADLRPGGHDPYVNPNVSSTTTTTPTPTPPTQASGGTGTPPPVGRPPVASPPPDDHCGCGDGWIWIYHGSQAIFDAFNVAAAIASQIIARGPRYHPELGYGIYFTDSASRAEQYMANKATGRIYRAKAPRELLDRLRSGRISTNGDPQWVVDNQADADILNQTIEWRTPLEIITGSGFPKDPAC